VFETEVGKRITLLETAQAFASQLETRTWLSDVLQLEFIAKERRRRLRGSAEIIRNLPWTNMSATNVIRSP